MKYVSNGGPKWYEMGQLAPPRTWRLQYEHGFKLVQYPGTRNIGFYSSAAGYLDTRVPYPTISNHRNTLT